MVKINEYIESGILESYLMGSASTAEVNELLDLKTKYPEISDALLDLEIGLERIAQHMAITPPPNTWMKIEDSIKELTKTQQPEALIVSKPPRQKNNTNGHQGEFIDIESPSNQMRVHKIWRWVLAAIFVLGKVFLGFAVYFYLQTQKNEQQIEKLQAEFEMLKKR